MAVINVDRGVEWRHTPHGIAVIMYVDEPGVYYNEHGAEVGVEAARTAGFPVDDLAREKAKRDAIAASGRKIAASYAVVNREVIEERGLYRVVHIGHDRFNVEFEDGSVMNLNGPLSKVVAMEVLDDLQPPAPPEVEKEKPGQPAKK